ncbi:hypothetical protein HFV01_29260 [Limnospira fusiformis SAG 85.79]|nr:hypothetical protein [Limnospira sp. PMC 1238.20]EKD08679.1 hypothetical protein SPLC1_S200800 [Arthrospira platensis C1]QJB29157.1 hypothetical protein HFV01_29260 [Limnospira fusiformis SAG 85.79]RAQ47740.1 hypothetical protein B9S53_03840 [Arthrospira sp. O9.13F]UWU45678.1 hypothetical protein APLC1_0361 [Arthrospira platensis C1]
MRLIVLGLVWFGLLSVMIVPVSEAAICRMIDNHQICIISLKRSAKYHWEYRAKLSIDGVAQGEWIYNCRDRLRVDSDGKQAKFEPNSFGEYLCRTVNY